MSWDTGIVSIIWLVPAFLLISIESYRSGRESRPFDDQCLLWAMFWPFAVATALFILICLVPASPFLLLNWLGRRAAKRQFQSRQKSA